MRIAADPVDEVHSRAAASLVSSPLVSAVGLIGKAPPKSWGARASKISDPAGFDILVGPADTTPSVDLVVVPSDVQDPESLRAQLTVVDDPLVLERYDEAMAATGWDRRRQWTIAPDLDRAIRARWPIRFDA